MPETKRINLALQGGGAHGAFTWGVLDRILDDPQLEIAGISATSAGALNGAALKSGLVHGDRETARANLDWLWGQFGAVEEPAIVEWMMAGMPHPALVATAMENVPQLHLADSLSRLTSPYLYGDIYRNPLMRIAAKFDYEAVCDTGEPVFNVCATNVRSGKIRVFAAAEIAPEVIVASTCLPTLFQAVEIDDSRTGRREAFWDGGYTGNPALFPLFTKALPDDIVIVNINPLYRSEVPISAQAIQNRINEISFNSSLLRELRAISFVKRLIAQGNVAPGSMKNVLVHMISDDALMNELNFTTKMVPTPYLLHTLKVAGQRAADAFLSAKRDKLNNEATVDLAEMFG